MSRRLLVADDSSTIQKVIKIAFARYAVEIVEAGSYIEALAAVGRATPDALILDASLPGARGPEDFARLLADSAGAPLLLLVGTYESVDEGAFRQAGFQHFLKKPFESSDIVQALDKLLGGELTAVRSPAPSAAAGGPTMPPLPGSEDRTRHATVIHAGGLPGLNAGFDPTRPPPDAGGRGPDTLSAGNPDTAGSGAWSLGDQDDDDLPGLAVPPPPPPMTDHARKGRRAFEPGTAPVETPEPGPGRPGGAFGSRFGESRSQASVPPPPPLSLSLDDDDPEATAPRRAAPRQDATPLPPIPSGAGGLPRAHRGDGGNEGLGLSLDEDSVFSPARSAPAVSSGSSGGGEISGDVLQAALAEQLPALVRQAVEEYCERHFKSLAREVIAAELRRLADEKARHLVDN